MLQYGYDLAISIPDLEVDDHGVRATLSFSRTPHLTVIPWTAVYAIASVDGRGVLYPEDVPGDVSVMAGAEPGEAAEAPRPSRRRSRPWPAARPGRAPARVFPRGASAACGPSPRIRKPSLAGAELAEPLGVRRRRRPQLRLVK